jgi:hypothetical protein
MALCRRGRVIAHPAPDSFCLPQVKLTMPDALALGTPVWSLPMDIFNLQSWGASRCTRNC